MSPEPRSKTSQSGTRVLRVMFALQGHCLDGLSNVELAKGLGETPATINRTLNTLIAEGAARKLSSGRYAPGMRLLQFAQATADELSRGQARINEITQRIHAGAH